MAIQGDQVKIGIDAPKHVDVFRKEIYDQIQGENKQATASSNLIKLIPKNTKQ